MRSFPLLLFLLLRVSLNAQVYSFRHFNEDAGLVQSFVYNIKQDRNGFLYVATGNGLSVFSGYSFTNYSTANGLKENLITTMHHDSRNRVWLGHFEGGVTIFSGGKCSVLPESEKGHFKVAQILEISAGNFLILKNGLGIVVYQESNNSFIIPDNDLFSDVRKVALSKDDLLLLKDDGVYKIPVSSLINKKKLMPEKIVSINNAEGMELTYDKSRLVMLNRSVVSILRNEPPYSVLDSYQLKLPESTAVTETFVGPKGNIYIGTTDMGLYKIEPQEGMVTNFTVANGLKSNAVQSLFVDREGNLWIGLYGKGLQQMNSELFNYNLITNENRQPVSINRMLKLNKKLYAATNEGIGVLTGNAISYIRSASLPKMNYNNLTSLAGKLFFSNEKGQLFESDSLLRNIKRLNYGVPNEVILINNLVAGKSCLYICSSGGLVKYTVESGLMKVYTTQEGLLHNNVTTVFEDSKNRLWICSPGSPLNYMDADGAVKTIDAVKGLNNYNINSIGEDGENNLWISTIGDGVIKLGARETKNYLVKQGLKSNYCYGIIVDRRNNVWVNHINGISYKVSPKTNFNRIEGNAELASMNFIENSYYYDKPNGKLYFGAAEGFVTVNTRKQKFNDVPALVNITELKLNGLRVNLETDSIFSYDSYDLSVDYTAICLTDPAKVKYKYILEGFDKDWHLLGPETRHINFSQVKDGSYSLKILVANNDDLWNEKPVVFHFVVKPPFWKKAWFYLVVAIGLGILFYCSVKWYTRRLIDKQRKLEEIIKEKTTEITFEKTRIEDLFKELKVKNTDLTDSINYARRIQEALLPLDSYIAEVFDAAYFYKPKDIVSGDFYWFKKTAHYSFAAAIDCTGHGVPGAFMSFIGATILDEVVNRNENLSPAEILNLLDKGVTKVLNQHSKEGDVNRDGMDVAICKFDKISSLLQVSSAGRPFYLYANNTITRFKGSKYSAGGAFQNIDKGFELFSTKVNAGDNLFLFSDGFTDQMGGPRGKKYSSKRLRNFLLELVKFKASDQKIRIEKEFESWQGQEEQTDDVLLISIKF